MSEISGGEALQKALDAIAAKLDSAHVLRVGFLESATDPVTGEPIAVRAAVNNFGAPAKGIPPRPFFTNMIVKHQAEWGPALGGLLVKHDMDANAALSELGEGMKGQLVQSIHDTNSPPLNPKTIARKGFAKPLIDTGDMWRAVDSEVS